MDANVEIIVSWDVFVKKFFIVVKIVAKEII